MQRIISNLDSGLSAFQMADPVIVVDTSGNGQLSSLDITLLLREYSGIDQPQIPAIPTGLPPLVRGGPDPYVSLPDIIAAAPGQAFKVPVTLDTAAGLESVQLRLAYDAAALELTGVDRGGLTGDFQWYVRKDEPGSLFVDMARVEAMDGGAGTLLELSFRVKDGARPGPRLLDLQWAQLNEGGLTLNPAPVAGRDETDARLQIQRPELAKVSQPFVGDLPVTASRAAAGANLASAPGLLPVIDWKAGAQTRLGFDMPASKSAQPGWVNDFVTGGGRNADDQNPNSKLRVKLPAAAQASIKASKLAKGA